jgi:putative DNA primase/helicase
MKSEEWVDRARNVPIEDEIARRSIKLKANGAAEQCGPCPVCGGIDRFSINTAKQVWNCRGCTKGGDIITLVQHLDGAGFDAACETLTGQPRPKPNGKDHTAEARKIVAAQFEYLDTNGAVVFAVERIEHRNCDGSPVLTKDGKRKKSFRQKRPDADRPGGWIWNTDGAPVVPYRLPGVINAVAAEHFILIVEGEAKADLLHSWNVPATCCGGGAGKWRTEHSEFLRGAHVVLMPDNDEAGRKHAEAAAASLQDIAASIRMLDLPGLPPKGDVIDWARSGGTVERLHGLIESEAKPWTPTAEPHKPAGDDASDVDAEIARLAGLSAVQYEKERKAAAERLGFRASTLDKLVEAERGSDPSDKQGRPISFPEPEPWPEAVTGAELLDGIAEAIRRHVVLPEHARDTSALWVMHTYLIEQFLVSPRLGIRSPVKGCGKTTLLDVLARLVQRPLPAANVTPAAIFRVIEGHQPTLLVDEADTFIHDNDELRGVLNSGHRKGGAVLRTVGEDHEPRAFSTYSACAIALIGTLPGTLHDRSVAIDLKRKMPAEHVVSFRPDRAGHLDALARKSARWSKDHAARIADIDPEVPPGIANREADNWRPLLAIAEEAGGEWPERGRGAAAQAHNAADDDNSRLELVLGHIRDVFAEKQADRIPSADLVASLVGLEGSPWVEMGHNRKPLTQNRLARMLKPVGVAPENIGADRIKGYLLAAFRDAFERYLAPEGVHNRSTAHNDDGSSTSDAFTTAQSDADGAVAKCEKSNNDGLMSGCAVVEGESSENGHQPLGRCAQCNGLAADAPLVRGEGYPPSGVHLHDQCRRFWLRSHSDA